MYNKTVLDWLLGHQQFYFTSNGSVVRSLRLRATDLSSFPDDMSTWRGKSGEGRKTVINKWSIIKTKHVKMFLISFHQWDFTEWIIRINVTAKMKTIIIYGWLIIWLYIVFWLAQKYLTHGDVIIVVEGLLKVGLYWSLFASY